MISKAFIKKIRLIFQNNTEKLKFALSRWEIQKVISWWKRDLVTFKITTRSAFQRMENTIRSISNHIQIRARLHRTQDKIVEQLMVKQEEQTKYLKKGLRWATNYRKIRAMDCWIDSLLLMSWRCPSQFEIKSRPIKMGNWFRSIGSRKRWRLIEWKRKKWMRYKWTDINEN